MVDTITGETAHWLRFEHTINALYDVAALPGVRQAEPIGFMGEGIERAISMEQGAQA